MTALNRTRTIIEDCEQVINDPEIIGGPIESYLVQHALVILCADVQQEVYDIVCSRADYLNDAQIANYVSNTVTKVLRSVKKEELAGFVGNFGRGEKERFNGLVDDAQVTRYNNAVNNRHEVAHKTGVQVTFSELKQALDAAENILTAVAHSIGAQSNP